MQRKDCLPFSLILIFVIAPFLLRAQSGITPDSTLYSIEMMDGNEFIGYKLFENEKKITLRTAAYGAIDLLQAKIKRVSVIPVKVMVNGEYHFENPQTTRYLWAPNGYGLKKGEGYYQNVWIFFNQVAFGLSDKFSLGGGMIPLFFFGGGPTPIWVTSKVSIPVVKDKFNVGGGALLGTVLGAERNIGEEVHFGILYGQTTFGAKDLNLSIGAGWGYSENGFARLPTFTLSGMKRLGPRGYLISENYFVNLEDEGFTLLSLAGRSIINKVSLDYGLFFPITYGQDSIIAIPWLGLVTPLGKKK